MDESVETRLRLVEERFRVELRGHQNQSLKALAQGKNVILHSPTGSGKSLVFQGAPYVLPKPGITVILYPLRALVKDQTKRMEEIGLESATLYGETKTKDRPEIYDKIQSGQAKLLLTTPESFDRNRRLQQILSERGVNLLVVDEAHAYEEWADGFRPTYRHAGRVAERIGVQQFLLCSATLTAEGLRTAMATLNRTEWTVVQAPPQRPNLIYRNLGEPEEEILYRAVLGKGLKAPGIVFFTTIKELTETAKRVHEDTGKKVLTYHGSMKPKDRRETQDTFMDGDHWIFATKAFGMGIDKSNIRSIIHWQMPSSILSYAQECVHQDTPVMTTGGNRPAREVLIGDKVLSYSPETGEPVEATVTDIYTGQTTRWVAVRTSAGDEALVTPNHPFIVDGAEVRADSLRVGDHLMTFGLGVDPDRHLFVADRLNAEATFATVAPRIIEEFRAKLAPAELSRIFRLSRPYDYNAYRHGKAAKLSALQSAADACGMQRGELYSGILTLKSRSSKPVRFPTMLDDADLGWFAGIVATDGYVFRSDESGFGSWKVKLTNTNKEIIDKFVRIVEQRFGLACQVFTKRHSKKPAYYAEVSSPVLCDLLAAFGIHSGRKSLTVDCSDVIHGAAQPFKAGFAAGVIDGDGNLSPPRDSKPQGSVRFHTASWSFASGFSRLLKSLGIHARLSVEDYTRNAHVMRCATDHGYNGEIGRFASLKQFATLVAPHMVKRMFNVKESATDARERIGPVLTSRVIEIREIVLDASEPTLNWRVEPHHLLWTANTLTHNCGRAGRDGEESHCLLTQSETGQAAKFLLDVSLPSPEMCRRVWNVLQEVKLESSSPWFEVDWDRVAKQTRLYPQTLQGAVSWLFTGKMIEKKQKAVNWKIILDAETDQKAALYKRNAPEIVDGLRGESMQDGAGTFEMRPQDLEEIVGAYVNDWRAKLRKLNELGIFKIEEPPAGRSTYRFLHNSFYFAEGEDQLTRARKKAFKRLEMMQRLQLAPESRRRDLIEEAISLDLAKLDEAVEVEVIGNQHEDFNEEEVPF